MIHRFYIDPAMFHEGGVFIHDEKMLHQMMRVLRFRGREKIVCFDNSGAEYVVLLQELHKKGARGHVIEVRYLEVELKQDIFLYQALPKNPAKFEFVLQKGTELGVHGFYPLISKRTEVQSLRNPVRLREIIREAAEQCGAVKLPQLFDVLVLEQLFKHFPKESVYVFYEGEQSNLLRNFLIEMRDIPSLHLFVGPEGGFTEEEIDFFRKSGAVILSLGKRILRTETASIAVLSALTLT